MSNLVYAILGGLFGSFFTAIFTRRIESDLLRQNLQKQIYDDLIVTAENSKQSLVNTWAAFSKFTTEPLVLRNINRRAGSPEKATQAIDDAWYAFIDEIEDAIFKSALAVGELQNQLRAYAFVYESLAEDTDKLTRDFDKLLGLQNETLMRLRDIDPKRLLENSEDKKFGETVHTSHYKKASDSFLDHIEKLQAEMRFRLFGKLFKVKK
jgi:hypothetical protein